MKEVSGDHICKHIPENLVEEKADWRNIWTGELFSFTTSIVVFSVSWCSLY